MDNVQSANIIKNLCKEKNIAISELLAGCEIRKGLIYDMEKRNQTPSTETLERIANYLNCSVDYLLGRDEQKEKSTPKNEGGLSKAEESLIGLFRQVPDKDKEMVTQMIETALKSRGLL